MAPGSIRVHAGDGRVNRGCWPEKGERRSAATTGTAEDGVVAGHPKRNSITLVSCLDHCLLMCQAMLARVQKLQSSQPVPGPLQLVARGGSLRAISVRSRGTGRAASTRADAFFRLRRGTAPCRRRARGPRNRMKDRREGVFETARFFRHRGWP